MELSSPSLSQSVGTNFVDTDFVKNILLPAWHGLAEDGLWPRSFPPGLPYPLGSTQHVSMWYILGHLEFKGSHWSCTYENVINSRWGFNQRIWNTCSGSSQVDIGFKAHLLPMSFHLVIIGGHCIFEVSPAFICSAWICTRHTLNMSYRCIQFFSHVVWCSFVKWHPGYVNIMCTSCKLFLLRWMWVLLECTIAALCNLFECY